MTLEPRCVCVRVCIFLLLVSIFKTNGLKVFHNPEYIFFGGANLPRAMLMAFFTTPVVRSDL